MTTMKSIFYEAQKNRIANPIWGWENILSEWNKRGPLYNGIPEIEEIPVHIDTKTVYEVEEKKIWK